MKINDTARGMPLTDATAAVTAMDLINRKEAPMATCPRDGEPLISTFKYPGAEFVCMVCGGKLGFLAPTPKKETPELTKRYEELKARFDAGDTPGKMEVPNAG